MRQSAGEHAIALIAYCIMPDHAHVLTEGREPSSSSLEFTCAWKHGTALDAWYAGRSRLWQRGFYDHLVRSDESAVAIAAYIMANPIRAGLSRALGEYPFAGSDVYSLEQLVDAMTDAVSPAVLRTKGKLDLG